MKDGETLVHKEEVEKPKKGSWLEEMQGFLQGVKGRESLKKVDSRQGGYRRAHDVPETQPD